MSVGILPGMASYAGAPAVDVNSTAAAQAGVAVPPAGAQNIGGKLALSFGVNGGGTVASTVMMFAVLYFGVMVAFHYLDIKG